MQNYEKAFELNPQKNKDYYDNKIIYLKNQKKYQELINTYTASINTTTDLKEQVKYYKEKICWLLGLKQYDKALEKCDTATTLDLDNKKLKDYRENIIQFFHPVSPQNKKLKK